MAVTKGDIACYKPVTITDAGSNGGYESVSVMVRRGMYNIMPRTTQKERLDGKTRVRKFFVHNNNASGSGETAYNVMVSLLGDTPAGDRLYLLAGTASDVQSDVIGLSGGKGGGALNANISAGSQEMSILMPANDYTVSNGDVVQVSSNYLTGQTVANTIRPGQAVYYNGSQWVAQEPPTIDDDDNHPYGTYLGSGVVATEHENGHVEFLTLQNVQHSNEVAGTGTGSQTVFSGTLGHVPVIRSGQEWKYTISSIEYTATSVSNGTITGTLISSGTVNEDGSWAITFSSAPDSSTHITATYHEKSWGWSGNVLTVKTVEQVANDYTASNTTVGFCLMLGDLKTSVSDKVFTSAGGAFDETKVILDNRSTVEDTWTFVFTSSTAFTVSGLRSGSVGSGSVSAQFSPTNPNVGYPYLTVPANAWSGTWTSGNTVTVKTHAPSAGVWLKQVVPAGTASFAYNVGMLDIYVE